MPLFKRLGFGFVCTFPSAAVVRLLAEGPSVLGNCLQGYGIFQASLCQVLASSLLSTECRLTNRGQVLIHRGLTTGGGGCFLKCTFPPLGFEVSKMGMDVSL